ncbi:FAD binding domain-containing protein [Caldinitratiruptor microaerophilus]|uniref:Molybdopterin dehydrogenase n=1 Tax=Caldinitratiruptor microaerophilus TaxID=671077 RepID=A0AA35CNF2_9FIRM|nr:xanthine dehydrogenase family protein subunit M [Caldinitratiruptor microaerophilus]BDG60792.1 molybdopterin dehydrogenase [Caldinitratiruptor microaerophilus]
MKPPRFDYEDPRTLPEALALLRQHGEDAKVLAGGQSLVPALNMRLTAPRLLVDLNRIPELAYIRSDGDMLAIGAMTRHAEVEHSPLVADWQPLLREAVRHVGHVQIRNRGTVGGSLAHADPAAELPAVWACLDGRFRIAGTGGVREVGPDDFFVMYYTTCIEPGEILVEVRLPRLPETAGYAFVEMARRSGDFAIVGVACVVDMGGDGAVREARIALTGVGTTPIRARGAEAVLQGERPGEKVFAEAGRKVREAVEPESDIHATAEYRRHLSDVLTRRALRLAVRQAQRGAEA